MLGIGRNTPCPCGSGKSYRDCCWVKRGAAATQPLAGKTLRLKPAQGLFHMPELSQAADTQPVRMHRAPEEDASSGEEEAANEETNGTDVHFGRSGLEQVCAQIDHSLPPITDAEEALVEGWWGDFEPVYRQNDAEAMIARILAFMEEHPTLFVHLGLDDDCLFDLGAELARRDQHRRYVELLLTIRREHPEVYVRSYGFYDRDLIAHLVAEGKRHEIARYLDLFQQYPDAFPGELGEVIAILLAANCGGTVFELVRATAIPLLCSPNLSWGEGDFAMRWRLFEQWLPVLDMHDSSAEACTRLLRCLESLDLPVEANFDAREIGEALTALFTEVPSWEPPELREQEDADRYYQRVCWRFCTFLHDQRGLGWASARYFADRMEAYLCEIPRRKRRKHPFAFEKAVLKRYLKEHCRELMYLEGIHAVALLQAVLFFCEMLQEHEVLSEEEVERVRADCDSLFADCREDIAETDPALRIFADFPRYRWADEPAG